MRIKLNNVGIIKNCDVEFLPGINLIVGASGSGKSTLMRCIYNTAVNDFSDSNISFNQNTMNVCIEDGDNRVEYIRSIKSNGDRFYYIVNGETYVKVGRQALPAVSEALKIGDVDVNGENINFNFNLQFSSPFLILGNQSTLYNVLTYRSTFDIASINDYYSADIKNNFSEISSNEKVKQRLEENLKSLEEQAKKLSPIENLYSDYISYKHNVSKLDTIKQLHENLKQLTLFRSKIEDLDSYITKVKLVLDNIVTLNEVTQYNEKCHLVSTISSNINKLQSIILSCDNAIDISSALSNMRHLYEITCKYYKANSISENISNLLSFNSMITNEDLVIDVLKQRSLICLLNKYLNVAKAIDPISDNKITIIDDLMKVYERITSLSLVFDNINKLNSISKKLENELAKFDICPLCGYSLTLCKDK